MSRTVSRRSASADQRYRGGRLDAGFAVQPLTSFVGREDDLATVLDLLRRPDVRLVTVTGTGGVGKTRLAIRAASAVDDAYPDGVVVVPLAPVRDPAMLLPTVAQRLNVPDAPDGSLINRLRTYLTDRDLLLVLDNLEHLLDAVPDIASLLISCPNLTMLCTCRAELNVSGEHLVPLAPLPAGEARALFVDRVRNRMPHFVLTEDMTPVIDAICQRLDGLPLAIELAASRVPALPPAALLARLERRLDLLTNGPRDAPPRLRDMRDAIAWSHDLLSESQQRLFRRLGVFIGGFTLEAAEAVTGNDTDVLDGIGSLVGASLIVPKDGIAGEPRYTMLETIREYALERLAASGEESEIRARHADYYRSLAEDALPLFDGSEIRIASDRVEIELDNCRGAMAWAEENETGETGIRLAGALWRIWQFTRSHFDPPWKERVTEGRMWIEHMLEMREGLPIEAITEALIGGSALARLQGDNERTTVLAEELLARARAKRYEYGLYWASGMLGVLAEDHGHLDLARARYTDALAVTPAMRNPENHRAIALYSLGKVARRAGDLAQSERDLAEALALSRITCNHFMIALTSGMLGRVLLERGNLQHAGALALESLLAYTARGQPSGIHIALVDLAVVASRMDQVERAARLLGAANTYPDHPDTSDTLGQATTDLEARLSTDAFAADIETGRHMAWDDVLAEVDALVESTADQPMPPGAEHNLSPRQLEVLRLVTEGHSNRSIADTLSVSERTVENHVFHIFNKLNVNSRAAAAAYAIRNGLL